MAKEKDGIALILLWCKIFDEYLYHGVYIASDEYRKELRDLTDKTINEEGE